MKAYNMKYNLFNSIIPLSKKSSLLYNSFSDSFIVFNSKFRDVVKNDFAQLQIANPTLAQMLVDSKCYVENEIDEFEDLRNLNNKIINNDQSYFVIINPTLACNFKCWYCYETHIPDSKMTEDIKNRVFASFDNIIKENPDLKHLTIGFFGGEPLLQFTSIVVPIIEYWSELKKQHNLSGGISFTSNGALISKTVISKLNKYKDVYFQITLDGDEEAHNKVRFSANNKGSYRLILDNIKQLLNNGIEVRMRINYTQDSIHTVKNVLDDIKDMTADMKRLLEVDFHRVWQDRDKANKAEADGIRDVLDVFIENEFKVIFNFRDEMFNSCYADRKNTCVVNYNGDIYKCTAKDFTKENRDGYLNELGQIVWENSQEHRRSLKLKNKPCHTCRIAPLCAGGCTRFILDHEDKMDNYCHFNYSDELMDQLILDRFDTLIRCRSIEEPMYDCESHVLRTLTVEE